MKILITDRPKLEPIDLPDSVQAVYFDESQRVPEEHRDAEAIVLWGNFIRDLKGLFDDLPNLKWIQTLMDGPDNVMALDLPKDIIITNGRHFHDKTVAEHALALALASVRRIPRSIEEQEAHHWGSRELGGVQALHPADAVTTLYKANVVVWGFGAIGQTIGNRLKAFEANVVGVAHTAGERGGFPVVTNADLPELLPKTDILIMILPSRPDTDDILDAGMLANLPARARVVNVGRGSTIDEDALMAALRDGRLASAALDVVKTEPLPADSPLWDTPNLLITPHAAGGRPIGAEARIAKNVRRFLAGEDLIGQMPR